MNEWLRALRAVYYIRLEWQYRTYLATRGPLPLICKCGCGRRLAGAHRW